MGDLCGHVCMCVRACVRACVYACVCMRACIFVSKSEFVSVCHASEFQNTNVAMLCILVR